MNSPVLVEIKMKLLITSADDPFDNIVRCLGIAKNVKGGPRECSKPAPKAADARNLVQSFMAEEGVPHNETFYDDVEDFLTYVHCLYHLKGVLERFREWKRERSRPVAGPPLSQPATAMDRAVIADQEESDVYNMGFPLTRQQADANTDELDVMAETLSSATISPSRESDIAFSVASPASTTVTTPGPTPSDAGSSPPQLHDASESRPETPTPVSRRPSASTRDLGTTRDELDEALAEHADRGPEILGRIGRRFKSVRRKKWPTLRIIGSDFGSRDSIRGKVYVWKHKANARLVKIGFTGQSSDDRHKQHGNCYANNTEPVWESETDFVGPYRVESIVRAQLAEWNIPVVECVSCKKGHREWFEMDAEEAKQLLRTWTIFVESFYSDGRLTAEGQERLDKICQIDPAVLVGSRLPARHNISLEEHVEEERTLLGVETEARQQSTLSDGGADTGRSDQPVTLVADCDVPPWADLESLSLNPWTEEADEEVARPTAPCQPTQVSDPLFRDRDAAGSSSEQATSPLKDKRRRSKLIESLRTLSTGKSILGSGREEGSEPGRSDEREELFAKLLGVFYRAEIKQEEERLTQGQCADQKRGRSSFGLTRKWVMNLRSRRRMAREAA